MRETVLSYYAVVRLILGEQPALLCCLCRCRHCGIFFITHPRNAKRTDLGCPFGCREAYRKQRSTERSMAYYRTKEGRLKKRIQNRRRGRGASVSPTVAPGQKAEKRSERTKSGASTKRDRFGIAAYLGMVLSLIEVRRVRQEEVEGLIERIMRQHSIAHRFGMDYVSGELKKSPP
jgi:hypothetical protein